QPFETLFYGDHGWLKLSGPNFEDISLSGECGNAVPEAFSAFCDGRRINARPHECDHLAYSSFQGLAVDVVGACRVQRAETLPDMRHALNMRQVIDAAVRSS